MQEDYYPRGGTRPNIANNNVVKHENLFNTLHKKVEKKRKRPDRTKSSTPTETIRLHLTCAELLSYEKILPGLVALGCIRNITPYTIEVELPGRTFVKVEINAITDILSARLLDEANNSSEVNIVDNVLQILSNIFIPRQFLPVFILELREDENKSKCLTGTLNPKHINSHLKYDTFKQGMLVWGSVLEKSDYVYRVSLGVDNTRVILPFKHCDNKVFVVGEPSWFIVREARIQDNAATITISANKEDISGSITEDGHIDQMIPGMCVEFLVLKVLKDGLEGIYFGEYLGYINQVHLDNPLDSLQKYLNTTIKAYILYVQPMTKFTFLTARNLHLPLEPPSLQKGYIGPAKIVQNTGKGLIVKLKKKELGLVTCKRLINSLKLDDSSRLTELVRTKFPEGSTHNCRILDYINMEKMYVCTFEKNELREDIFSKDDLEVGKLVKGVVEGINNSGVTVRIGKLCGFATNEHLSNAQYSDNLKRNYHIGDRVTARIWHIDGNGIKLTLKQSFVQDDKCLTSYQTAKKNEEYKGMVVKTYDNGVLVCFYGGTKGWLNFGDRPSNYKDMFYQGQVINVTICFIDGAKLFLTLDQPKRLNHRKLQVGQFTSGTVESINSHGIFIRTVQDDFQGFIPASHLSINCKLSNTMLSLFKLGDNIGNLICIGKEKRLTLSLREFSYYKDNKLHILRRNQLKPGLLLRCSVKSYDEKQLLLTSPVLFFNDYIRVDKEDIVDDDRLPEVNELVKGQAVIAKLTVVNDEEIMATVKLADVFDYNFQYSVDLLEKYLNEVGNIHNKLAAIGDNLAQYKIGQRVTCTIKKINNVGCSVSLKDGVQGIVAPEHWPNKPLIGSSHEGVVLYVNFINKYLEISLNDFTNQKISKIQGNAYGIKPNQTIYARLLLIRTEFVLCCLGRPGNRQIGYMPTALHENDFRPNYDYYRGLTGTFKFVVASISNGKIIGLQKNLKRTLEKNYKLLSKVIRKRKWADNDIIDQQSPKKVRLSTLHNDIQQEILENRNGQRNNINKKRISWGGEETVRISPISVESDVIDCDSGESSEASVEENEYLDKSEEDYDSTYTEDSGLNEDYENFQKECESVPTVKSAQSEPDEIIENSRDQWESVEESDESESDEIVENCSEESESKLTEESAESECEEEVENYQEGCDIESADDDELDLVVKNKQEISNDLNSKNLNAETSQDITRIPCEKKCVEKSLNESRVKFLPPSIQNFFDLNGKDTEHKESSDEDAAEDDTKSKKKKLTRAEQVKLINQQEKELREKELELVDSVGIPQSAEQFDRRLLADPNASDLWTRYISFHLMSAEFDKARAIIKRALQTVDLKAEQDRLNIWIAALNVENFYGTTESFAKVFEEAARCNDDFTIYMQALRIKSQLDNSNFDEFVKRACAKFKQNPKMYIEIGQIYYSKKRFKEARQLKDKALRTISNQAEHIPLIVKFAIMEFNYGEDNQAEALFETILQSNPGKVDVWCTYVDQLVKKNKIDIARRVIERAVTQKLNTRKMKTLYKKYQEFEQTYGNEETREQQKKILSDYIKQISSKA